LTSWCNVYSIKADRDKLKHELHMQKAQAAAGEGAGPGTETAGSTTGTGRDGGSTSSNSGDTASEGEGAPASASAMQLDAAVEEQAASQASDFDAMMIDDPFAAPTISPVPRTEQQRAPDVNVTCAGADVAAMSRRDIYVQLRLGTQLPIPGSKDSSKKRRGKKDKKGQRRGLSDDGTAIGSRSSSCSSASESGSSESKLCPDSQAGGKREREAQSRGADKQSSSKAPRREGGEAAGAEAHAEDHLTRLFRSESAGRAPGGNTVHDFMTRTAVPPPAAAAVTDELQGDEDEDIGEVVAPPAPFAPLGGPPIGKGRVAYGRTADSVMARGDSSRSKLL
jgi:hypothetical protein